MSQDLRREGYVSGFKYIGFKDLPLYIGRENPGWECPGHALRASRAVVSPIHLLGE